MAQLLEDVALKGKIEAMTEENKHLNDQNDELDPICLDTLSRRPWFAMDSKRVRDEGLFYSALANFLFRNPGRQDLISPETIGDIAARWKMGSPLTIEHIEPGHPSYRKPTILTMGCFALRRSNKVMFVHTVVLLMFLEIIQAQSFVEEHGGGQVAPAV
ncbi:hypothetical protein J7337_006104 [Fusarium musae]|uniref:Uncharacterized protein n=1 Tax=Fusarium musae TaxID=1042133 RepID=A0A9P8DJY6_9HYPO|nr:hypothetical protein J7337_006104 [Fusarium musae]KAG9503261.1 hypothetical protein J7337_006104 [Fusarium musae]